MAVTGSMPQADVQEMKQKPYYEVGNIIEERKVREAYGQTVKTDAVAHHAEMLVNAQREVLELRRRRSDLEVLLGAALERLGEAKERLRAAQDPSGLQL